MWNRFASATAVPRGRGASPSERPSRHPEHTTPQNEKTDGTGRLVLRWDTPVTRRQVHETT